jgi:hypothetical protein
MTVGSATVAGEPVDVITDANVDCVAVTGRCLGSSIAMVDDTITIPQFRTLVILSNRGPVNLATLTSLLDTRTCRTYR